MQWFSKLGDNKIFDTMKDPSKVLHYTYLAMERGQSTTKNHPTANDKDHKH